MKNKESGESNNSLMSHNVTAEQMWSTNMLQEKNLKAALSEIIRNSHNVRAINNEEAIAKCIIEAIKCGDFFLQCEGWHDVSTAYYKPARRIAELEAELKQYKEIEASIKELYGFWD